jgi:hypothetical protein
MDAAAFPHSSDVNAAIVDAYGARATIKRVCEVVLQPHSQPSALAVVRLPGGKLDTVALIWVSTANVTPHWLAVWKLNAPIPSANYTSAKKLVTRLRSACAAPW